MPRSDQFDYGYVVGIFVESTMDGPDAGRLPDARGATDLTPTFVRSKGQWRHPLRSPDRGAEGMFVSGKPIRAGVMPNGHMTSDVDSDGRVLPGAQPGVWLPVGEYTFSVAGYSQVITVTTSHTQDSPLDLFEVVEDAP